MNILLCYFLHLFRYPLPVRFHSAMVAQSQSCNSSMFSAEVHFHRYLMSTPSVRSEDPDAAKFFYIPVYSTCNLTTPRPQVLRTGADPHRWQRRMVADALEWLDSHDSYSHYLWGRGGLDHILTATHDFGRCFTHRDVGKGVTTSDGLGRFLGILRSMVYLQYNGDTHAGASCYEAGRDVVLPPVSKFEYELPEEMMESMQPVGSALKSPWRAMFRGTTEFKWFGRQDPGYSRGVRQALRRLYGEGETKNEGVVVTVAGEKVGAGEYLREMAEASFCVCPRGYAGWTQRFADSVKAGCLPILISDHTSWPYDSFLRYETFTISVSEADASSPGRLPHILSRLTFSEISTKKTNLLAVRPLFSYRSIQTQYWDSKWKAVPREELTSCGACLMAVLELSTR
ncbi:hypothetical protein AAMO2058_000942400 [Amorphochlora amoebiformis]